VYLLGGGEDTAQQFAAGWLRRHDQLRWALESSAVTLAVCAGLQILGRSLRDASGQDYPGLGLLDITTAPGPRRAVGEVITTCAVPGVGSLTGFENHRGLTTCVTAPNALPRPAFWTQTAVFRTAVRGRPAPCGDFPPGRRRSEQHQPIQSDLSHAAQCGRFMPPHTYLTILWHLCRGYHP
jgi:cobyric acid synthase